MSSWHFLFAALLVASCTPDTFATDDAAVTNDGATSDGGRCNSTHNFGLPQDVIFRDTSPTSPIIPIHGVARFSQDELTMFFDDPVAGKIYTSTRANRNADFVGENEILTDIGKAHIQPAPDVGSQRLFFEQDNSGLKAIFSDTIGGGASELPFLSGSTNYSMPYVPKPGAMYFVTTDGTNTIRRTDISSTSSPVNQSTPAFGKTLSIQANAVVVDGTESLLYYSVGIDSGSAAMFESRFSSGTWSTPIAAPVVASPAPDRPTWLSPDGCRLYYRVWKDITTTTLVYADRT